MNVLQYILDLGPAVMLPAVIFVLGLLLRQGIGKSLRSGITIGVGFVGITLVISLLTDNLGPAAQEMAERFNLGLSIVDVGWPGASPMAWASNIGTVAIPVAILVNVVMLLLKWTRVVNVDIWNIWHMAFAGAIVSTASGSFWLGVLGVVIYAAFAYKLGDWFAPIIHKYNGLEGISIPHGTGAIMAPIAVVTDAIIEKIPGLKNVNINSDKIENRLGPIGEPAIIGAILGTVIGALAGYEVSAILQLGIQMAAVMLLMPTVVKFIMEGLMPIAEAAREMLDKRFSGQDYYIGLDPALLLGNSQVVAASLIFVPLTLVIAILIPGNEVLPFGDLATIGFFISIAVGIHGGNLFRTLISGTLIMTMTIWIANMMVGVHTQLALNTGTISGGQVASLDQGGSPLQFIMTELTTWQNLIPLIVVTAIYGFCVVFTIVQHKRGKLLPAETDKN
ncbi:PTS galactitol transporter subunit IIC [Shouchella clausii]|jgi:galactitol PTS system EIIC component|uniref:PTS galactitol transporter subunit IIC n=1 Tax=Shouchella clausii TaxID=79880 RepID=UPI000B97350E|nr:galactitol-specific PTS transporter subunit IIC [Shouchella clausii]AST96191.1 PTS galactitol transporter subunit IIC [Shouchella clausii]MBU8598655.1 galactitol-specific PTS transporter subunit IIC [Shouchella clausii]MCR1288679.1 galactitol-specific PTS transporter subunit IIC [Shouchella clausii]MCY1104092.1 galactitol-specific PTS transporter subunit IIC [Shouchella clausii]MEB5473448.1 galactitol-specific PTS transporter subunit IIC [Shouchella clausii]